VEDLRPGVIRQHGDVLRVPARAVAAHEEALRDLPARARQEGLALDLGLSPFEGLGAQEDLQPVDQRLGEVAGVRKSGPISSTFFR
jgi:hypothetical protein